MTKIMVALFAIITLFSAQYSGAQSDTSTSSNQLKDVSKDEPTYQLDSINISPTESKLPSDSAPATISVIENEQLEAQQAQDLADNLKGQPGVTVSGGPRSVSQAPQIRGFGSERVIILQDGMRQNFKTEHSGRFFLDPELMKRVEVVKGPQSSLFGSGAIGGVVSYTTKSAKDYLEGDENVGAQLEAGFAGANNEERTSLTSYGRGGSSDVLAHINNRNSDNIRLGNGQELLNSASQSDNVFVKFGQTIGKKQRLELSYSHLKQDTRAPLNPELELDPRNDLGDILSQQESLTLNYKINPKNQLIDTSLTAYNQETESLKTRLADRRLEERKVTTTGAEAFNHFRFKSSNWKHTITLGGEYYEDRSEGLSNGAPLGNFPSGKGTSTGTYLQYHTLWNSRLSITPGVRYDRYTLTNEAGLERTDAETTAKIGMGYNISESTLVFANLGQGFNAPSLQLLYHSGFHFPSSDGLPNNFFVANDKLKAERSLTREMGLRHIAEDLLIRDSLASFEIAVYETEAEDFITRDVDFVGGTTNFANKDEVKIQGYELGAEFEAYRNSWRISYAQARSQDLATQHPLNDTPADQWNFRWRWQALKDKSLYLGYVGVLAEAQDRVSPGGTRSASGPGTAGTPTSNYFVHDIYATYHPKALKRATVLLRINNVLDKNYRVHGSALAEAGRDVRLSLRYSL